MRRDLRLAGALMVFALAGDARAQPPRHVLPGYHRHDGLFLRIAGGIGFVNQTTLLRSAGSLTAQDGQPAGIADFAIGYSILENFALHLSVSGSVATRKELTTTELGTAHSQSRSVAVIGPGITYHLMPTNLFVTFSVGGATMKVDYGNVEYETPKGGGFMIGVGKEWWVSANWGVGVMGQIGYARVADAVGDWNLAWGGVAFSATYN